MVVILMEKASASLRGELSRWLIEPKVGVFVGDISAMVRDKLWAKIVESIEKEKLSGALLLYSAQSEQGFLIKMEGKTTRTVKDWEGVSLPFIPKKKVEDSSKLTGNLESASPKTG